MAKSDNPADKPIDYSTAFNTARRNVLFWGAATLLIACGTAGTSDDIALSAIMAGLAFNPNFLTLASMATLIFMLVGYRNAERRLIARHTDFALSERIGHAADEIESLQERAKQLREKAAKADDILDQLFQKRELSGEGVITDPRKDSAYIDKEMVKHLASLPNELRGFGRAIGSGEKAWFHVYERSPVWVLSAVAFLVATWRLVDATSLDVALTALIG